MKKSGGAEPLARFNHSIQLLVARIPFKPLLTDGGEHICCGCLDVIEIRIAASETSGLNSLSGIALKEAAGKFLALVNQKVEDERVNARYRAPRHTSGSIFSESWGTWASPSK